MGPRCVVSREQFTVWGGGWQRQKAAAGWGMVAWRKSKDSTQRAWRNGGGKSEKDRITAEAQRAQSKAIDLTQRARRKAEDTEKAGEILHPRSRVQDDDAGRIVKESERAGPAKRDPPLRCVMRLTPGQAGAQRAAPLQIQRSRRDAGATQ